MPPATAPGPALAVRGLVKRYGQRVAVDGISLAVGAGSIVGLLGPNGAGKSTTVECIVGLRQPDSGSIHVAGIDALAAPRQAARLLGAQLQATALQDAITVGEAVALFRSFHQRGPTPAALLAEVGLSAFAGLRYATLSQGQRQSLAFALALVHDPLVLVLDEATAGLDPHARQQAHALIRRRAATGTAVLLATQDIAEAEQLCDRVVVLAAGTVVADGPPALLIAESGLPTRITLRTRLPFSASCWDATVSADGLQTSISTSDPTRVLAEALPALASGGNALLDLQLARPTLEEVFLARTGKRFAAEAAAENACAV